MHAVSSVYSEPEVLIDMLGCATSCARHSGLTDWGIHHDVLSHLGCVVEYLQGRCALCHDWRGGLIVIQVYLQSYRGEPFNNVYDILYLYMACVICHLTYMCIYVYIFCVDP